MTHRQQSRSLSPTIHLLLWLLRMAITGVVSQHDRLLQFYVENVTVASTLTKKHRTNAAALPQRPTDDDEHDNVE